MFWAERRRAGLAEDFEERLQPNQRSALRISLDAGLSWRSCKRQKDKKTMGESCEDRNRRDVGVSDCSEIVIECLHTATFITMITLWAPW